MNYSKIYDDFIADRLLKEPEVFKGRSGPSRLYHVKNGNAPDGYEHHHIVPKALGGSDDPENIISIPLDEHWFAHCLLAKIYGGKMWTALWCMGKLATVSTGRRKAFKNRHLWAVARKNNRKQNGKNKKGKPNIGLRKQVTLKHKDGRSITGYLSEVSAKTGISLASVSRLLNREQGVTYCGWYAYEDEAEKSRQAKKANGINRRGQKSHNAKLIICVETGEIFENRELAAASVGLSQGRNITSVCLGRRNTAGGKTWRYVTQSNG